MSVFAEANTSAGAPLRIWVASAFEPANEYFSFLSIAGNASVSDAAASTLIGSKVGIGAAACNVNAPLRPRAASPLIVDEYLKAPAFANVTASCAVLLCASVGVFFPAIAKLCLALPVFLTAKVTASPAVAVFLDSVIALSVIVTLTVVVARGAAAAAASNTSDSTAT